MLFTCKDCNATLELDIVQNPDVPELIGDAAGEYGWKRPDQCPNCESFGISAHFSIGNTIHLMTTSFGNQKDKQTMASSKQVQQAWQTFCDVVGSENIEVKSWSIKNERHITVTNKEDGVVVARTYILPIYQSLRLPIPALTPNNEGEEVTILDKNVADAMRTKGENNNGKE